MSAVWPLTKKSTRTGRAMLAPITQHNMSTKRNASRTSRTSTAKAAKAKATPAAAAPAAITPAAAAPAITPAAALAAITADPAMLAALMGMLGITPTPAPAAPAPAPAAPAPAPVAAPAKAAPAVPDDIKALVGRTIVIRYEAAKYPGRPLVYTVSVDTAWCAKGTVFIKGPVAERDGAERWFEVPRIRDWISRG